MTMPIANGLKRRLKGLPVIGSAASRAARLTGQLAFPGSLHYWERRYRDGGSSGAGSFGNLARFKAEVINDFVEHNNIASVIEYGCGDGNQLALAKYKSYIGLDVSKAAISRCIQRFRGDTTKSFFYYDSAHFVDNHSLFIADLAISLDVIYHLVEDALFEAYMRRLFGSAGRSVIIYSSNEDATSAASHVRHRSFSKWVEENEPEWELTHILPNRYPFDGNIERTSFADFFFYSRTHGGH